MWDMEDFNAAIFGGYAPLAVAFWVACGVTLVAATLAYVLRAKSVYLAFALVIFGGTTLTVCLFGIPVYEITAFFAALGVCIGAAYILLFALMKIREAVERRREEKASKQKRLQFALPDRDNSFVRARLNTVLRVEEEPEKTSPCIRERVEFSHARTLLAKLKDQPLSVVERLETDELSKLVSLYLQKETFTAEDAKLVNEAFSRILKLSAKYAV